MTKSPNPMAKARNFPYALPSPVRMDRPNQSIPIYRGRIKLVAPDGPSLEEKGTIKFRWLPRPAVEFRLEHPGLFAPINNRSDARIFLMDTVHSGSKAFIGQSGFDSRRSSTLISGIISEPLVIGAEEDLQYIRFGVVNFDLGMRGDLIQRNLGQRVYTWTGRLTLESAGWRIIIDAVRDCQSLRTQLKNTGGYAITHVGRIDKGGEPFSISDVSFTLRALDYFLSFVCGRRCQAIPLVGYIGGRRIMESWWSPRVDIWRYVFSWAPILSEPLPVMWDRFLTKWNRPIWREMLSLTMEWYLDANTTPGVEMSLVKSLIGLEQLAWAVIVEKEGFDADEFGDRRFPLHRRIECLLKWAGLPRHIPHPLENLIKHYEERRPESGPHALTQIRNGIVHPRDRHRFYGVPTGVKHEARQLGLWYLEICLLKLLGYPGGYISRLQPGVRTAEGEELPDYAWE